MKTIDEIRRANMAKLASEYGGVAALAEVTKKSPSQLSQWIHGSTHSDTGKARGMRSSSCREIERSTGKPEGWLEAAHEDGTIASFDTNVAMSTLGVRAIPVLSAVQAGHLKEIPQAYSVGDGYEVIFVDSNYSKSVFALEIEGISMMPDFKPGDFVVIDPEISPNPGDYVVAKNCEEEATFKKYRQREISENGEIIFELVPLNEDYPTLRSDTMSLSVIGVMVEHRRKFRKR